MQLAPLIHIVPNAISHLEDVCDLKVCAAAAWVEPEGLPGRRESLLQPSCHFQSHALKGEPIGRRRGESGRAAEVPHRGPPVAHVEQTDGPLVQRCPVPRLQRKRNGKKSQRLVEEPAALAAQAQAKALGDDKGREGATRGTERAQRGRIQKGQQPQQHFVGHCLKGTGRKDRRASALHLSAAPLLSFRRFRFLCGL